MKTEKLYNQYTNEELREQLSKEEFPRTTISFYRYLNITNPQMMRDELYKQMSILKVLGRIYVAHEGINAQISVPTHNLDKFSAQLDAIDGLQNIRLNIAIDNNNNASFLALKIKVRNKIVADGIDDHNFNAHASGKYVDAYEFNKLAEDATNTILVDMRNHYEYEVGHFENAFAVPSDTFREQLPLALDLLKDKKDKNIVMYCTGGIRCEKASAWMIHNGFKNVYHLAGGIINYVKQVKELGLTNKFRGKNFVFDNRLGEAVNDEIIANCHQCHSPCDVHVNCANDGCHLLFIQCATCAKTYANCCSKECYDIIHLSPEEQKELRRGINKGANIFNKAKARTL